MTGFVVRLIGYALAAGRRVAHRADAVVERRPRRDRRAAAVPRRGRGRAARRAARARAGGLRTAARARACSPRAFSPARRSRRRTCARASSEHRKRRRIVLRCILSPCGAGLADVPRSVQNVVFVLLTGLGWGLLGPASKVLYAPDGVFNGLTVPWRARGWALPIFVFMLAAAWRVGGPPRLDAKRLGGRRRRRARVRPRISVVFTSRCSTRRWRTSRF